LILHGGAGTWRKDDERVKGALEAIEEALEKGLEILDGGGSAGEAVVKSIEIMEDSGYFNAGSGSALNIEGVREMDAAYGDSRGNIGAVASVRYPKNPVALARYVAIETDHLLLAGEGADSIAARIDLEKIGDPSKNIVFRYNELIEGYKGLKRFPRNIKVANYLYGDTVGAIALDKNRELAVAVSTGGIWLKLPGRVGDTPIFGGGFYISRDYAVCATGIGEVIMRGLISYRAYLEYEETGDVYRSLMVAIDHAGKIMPESTGLIALDINGSLAYRFNTKHMMVAYYDGNRKVSILDSNI